MKLIPTSVLVGALAIAGIAASAPASAMPASPLASVAVDSSTASPVETVRYRRFVRHRFLAPRRGFYRGRRYGYRRGLPGHPIRRILRAL